MKQQKYVYDNCHSTKNPHKIKFSIVAMVFMVAMLFLSCSDSSKQDVPKDNFAEQNYPEVDATDFELVYTEKGIIRSLLSTPKLIKYETKERSYTEFPDGFHITKFDENKNKTSELSANYGKHFEKEKKWEALGNVIAINLDGDTLRTEHLIMLEKDNRIYSEKYVKITRKDQIITGIGFESDLDMNDYVVKEVKGTIYSGVE